MAICQLLTAFLHQDQSELEAPFIPKQVLAPSCHPQFCRKVGSRRERGWVGGVNALEGLISMIPGSETTLRHTHAHVPPPSLYLIPTSLGPDHLRGELLSTGFLILDSWTKTEDIDSSRGRQTSLKLPCF